MAVENTMINDKRLLIIMTRPEGDGVETQTRWYKHLLKVWIAWGRSAEEEDVLSTLRQVIEPRKTHYVFAADPETREKIKE
jgi:hypothetical protein